MYDRVGVARVVIRGLVRGVVHLRHSGRIVALGDIELLVIPKIAELAAQLGQGIAKELLLLLLRAGPGHCWQGNVLVPVLH